MSPNVIEAAPIRTALEQIEQLEENARGLKDERTAAVIADVRKLIQKAVADAENPPPRMRMRDYAAREGITLAAAYKRKARGKVVVSKDSTGHITVAA